MRLSRPDADIFVPSGEPLKGALKRATLLGVAAHPDDLECMALEPIVRGRLKLKAAFVGLVVASGSGGRRTGKYRGFSGKKWVAQRRKEQREAALLGAYAVQIQLGHPSRAVLDPEAQGPTDDLVAVLKAVRPREVFCHDLADRHATHLAVLLKLVAAIRRLPKAQRPERLVGCEVWRSLDWLNDQDKVVMPINGTELLGAALLGVFDSQIGAKRYDLGAVGRRRANAVFSQRLSGEQHDQTAFGMDLTPLLRDDDLSPQALFNRYVSSFQREVIERIHTLGARPKRGGKA